MKEISIIGLAEKVNFLAFQRYLTNNKWEKIESKREDAGIFRSSNGGDIFEIHLPLSRSLSDYGEGIERAIVTLSKFEDRDAQQILNDLLAPPADIIRFRVKNTDTENGIISLNAASGLIDNARNALIAAACDILQPEIFHKRLALKGAQDFIDACFLGQTERGSFVASIICPFIEIGDEETKQLSIFNTESQLVSSFTRKTTIRFVESLAKIKKSIEAENYFEFTDINRTEIISVNLLQSVAALGQNIQKGEIEIHVNWASNLPHPQVMEDTVSFTEDYMLPLDNLIHSLLPVEKTKEGAFVGKISDLKAEPDITQRKEGIVVFNFLEDDDQIVKADVILDKENFDLACEAFEKGLNVKITGVLRKEKRKKYIDNAKFATIE